MKLELTYRGWTQKREHLCNTQSNTVAQMLSLWCLYPCYVIMCEAIVCNVKKPESFLCFVHPHGSVELVPAAAALYPLCGCVFSESQLLLTASCGSTTSAGQTKENTPASQKITWAKPTAPDTCLSEVHTHMKQTKAWNTTVSCGCFTQAFLTLSKIGFSGFKMESRGKPKSRL